MPFLLQRRKIQTPAGWGGGFNPASLAWATWNRGSYGGAPWLGTASAGASGSRSWGGGSPAVGAALNGFTGALFSGAQVLGAVGFTLSDVLGSATLPVGWTFFCLVSPSAFQAPGSATFDRPQLATDSGGWWGVAVNADGVSAWAGDGTAANAIKETSQTVMSLNVPVVVTARWTGTQLQCRLGKTGSMTAAQVACGGMFAPFSTVAGNDVFMGRNYSAAAFLSGTIWEHGFLPFTASDSQVDQVCAEIGARYGV